MTVRARDEVGAFESSGGAALGGAMTGVDEPIPPSSRMTPASAGGPRRRAGDRSPSQVLEEMRAIQAKHPFWDNRLFRACAAGHLGRDDFELVFSQYYLYSKNFTRYLAALMANLDSDYHRARLAENLWEEGGGAAPEARHAEIFRKFLRGPLGIDVDDIEYSDATRFFVREYLDFCQRSEPMAASAFLSLGTEGIVPRMYGIFLDGLAKAGIREEEAEFFRIHIACDDAHAATLEEIMLSYASKPEWASTCLAAMRYALSLRERFFEQLYEAVEMRRVREMVGRIRGRASLAPAMPPEADLRYRIGGEGSPSASVPLYSNVNERLGIDFAVERVPFGADVFDTRILRVAPRRNNELHKHAHESLFYVIQGRGRVTVNEASVEVRAGDVVFVPRWAVHQSHNLGDEELVVLAITDANLTDRCALGGALKQTRLKDGRSAPR